MRLRHPRNLWKEDFGIFVGRRTLTWSGCGSAISARRAVMSVRPTKHSGGPTKLTQSPVFFVHCEVLGHMLLFGLRQLVEPVRDRDFRELWSEVSNVSMFATVGIDTRPQGMRYSDDNDNSPHAAPARRSAARPFCGLRRSSRTGPRTSRGCRHAYFLSNVCTSPCNHPPS